MKRNQKASVLPSLRLETLPAEIRNLIFEICIYNALNTPKQIRGSPARTSKPSNFTVSVFPRWSGPGSMRTDGIGPLPLLFASKQMYKEVSSLVYSILDSVSIGGYLLQHPDEDPSIRWAGAYSLLRNQPSLLKYTKKVRIFMPTLRQDLQRGYWQSLGPPGLKAPTMSASQHNRWAIVPDLESFLRNFENLSTLEITVTTDNSTAPEFEGLLPLYDLCGKQTDVNFCDSSNRGAWSSVSAWSYGWEQCLRSRGRL